MTTLHDPDVRGFASDNYAGVHPEVLAAIAAANGGHQISYGADVYTARLAEVLGRELGAAEVYPVFNGTGANVLSLQSMLPRWGAVICAESAHINTDENAAPERVGGIKLLTVHTVDGKLTPELVDRHARGSRDDEHRAQPGVVSITQSTELGTVYSVEEIRAVADHAHSLGLAVHMDGSRLSNAAAALDVPLRAITADVGVDLLSLGGTKNGLLGAEAVVVLDPSTTVGLRYLRKVDMQLSSKMRFMSAQLLALYDGDLWLRSAGHANAMARRLYDAVREIPGVTMTNVPQANAVFAILPAGVADRLRERFRFYDWDPARGEVRWMCAWDTTEADVDAFAAAIRRETARVA
ncbi:low specificity L-threonine aldolase [Cellulomonas sp. ATA003]|uniref:threonine aldolase family protein n=1 Tax=Cellulomonas sp. ATA003 TaxID=3073064 RepID=UPI00287313D4|nr:low specificity L-threonine aldolase [Cellulomonas sp. ATA003]WNB84324.1 low specificity L-threonine aldolase [Cellulomonas sp. ATA003]